MNSSERQNKASSRLRALVLLTAHSVIHTLCKIIPRRSSQWVFGYQDGLFLGNPKMLFLWLHLHRPDLKATWISEHDETRRLLRRNGLRAYKRWSLPGVYAALAAKVFVYAHGLRTVNLTLSGGAFLLNLWHGVGLKGVKHGYKGGSTARNKGVDPNDIVRRWNDITYLLPPDSLVTTSDFMQQHFATQFRLPPERCPQLGYPRLDCAQDPELLELVESLDRQLGFSFNPLQSAEVYIYMPTFRDTKRPFVQEALPDLGRLSDAMASRNATLYIKLHPYTKADLTLTHDNILDWPDKIDIHAYLQRFTGLITDYSSILYDYLAVKEIGAILYTFDYDEYLSTDRSLLYPFEDNVAGLRVSDFDELCRVLENGDALSPQLKSKALEIRNKFWGGSSKPASSAIVDHTLRAL